MILQETTIVRVMNFVLLGLYLLGPWAFKLVEARGTSHPFQKRAILNGCSDAQTHVVKRALWIADVVAYLAYEATGPRVTNQSVKQLYHDWFGDYERLDLRTRARYLFEAIHLEIGAGSVNEATREYLGLNDFQQIVIHCEDVDERCGMWPFQNSVATSSGLRAASR